MNKYIFLLSFLFFYGITDLFAQEMQNTQSGGTNNTQINIYHKNTYLTNKKELAELKNEQIQTSARIDSNGLIISRIEQRIAMTDSMFSDNIAKRDLLNQMLSKERDLLIHQSRMQKDSIIAQNKRITQLETIIDKQKKDNLAPFGIKQFKNDQKVLGYTFLISQIAVPIALGVGFECAANKNHQNYKNQIAQTLSEHNDYYKKYKNYHQTAIWTPIAAGAILYGMNLLCNYYYTNNQIAKKYFLMTPDISSDLQGNYGVGIKMSFNF